MSRSCDYVLMLARLSSGELSSLLPELGSAPATACSAAACSDQPVQPAVLQCVAGTQPGCSSGLGPAKNALEVGHKKAESGSKKYKRVRAHLNISPNKFVITRSLPAWLCVTPSAGCGVLVTILSASHPPPHHPLLSLFSLLMFVTPLYKLFPVPSSQPGEFLLSNDSLCLCVPPPPGCGAVDQWEGPTPGSPPPGQ